MTADVVVGAGMAGLTAALRLARAGRRVVVLAKGMGSLPLSPATVDILGYGPDRVASPASAWEGFVRSHPDHPYARLPLEVLEESVAWFKAQLEEPRYVGDAGRNFLLPTAVGALRPSAVVPLTMAAGDLSRGGRVVIVGWRALKDFNPFLVAGSLTLAGSQDGVPLAARAVEIDAPAGMSADASPVDVARLLDDPRARAELVQRLAPELDDGDEAVGFPAVLGLAAGERVWEELEANLERPVFEIPTVPPSVPGLRLFNALKSGLREAGARLVIGAEVAGADVSGDRLTAVRVVTSGRTRTVAADHVLLATGGWAAGGLELDSRWEARETVLGLPVASLPEPGRPRFLPGYFDSHPLARAGIAVDDRFRPMDGAGRVVHGNVHAVGALLGGAEPWREKSGDGISLASGYRAAGAILEEGAE